MEDKDYKTLKEELNSTFSFEYCLIDISDDRGGWYRLHLCE